MTSPVDDSDPQAWSWERRRGEAALLNGFLTRAQLDECLALQRAATPPRDLASILRAQGYLTEDQVAKLWQGGPVPSAFPLPSGPNQATERTVVWPQEWEEPPAAPPSPTEAMIGKTLAGDFWVKKLLGRGAMGAVYLAEQVSLERPVALKLLPADATGSRAAVARFQLEAKAAARLSHPNIVQVYAFGQEKGQYFIAMEYVEGETLAQRLRRVGWLPPHEALFVSLEVARALAAAHEQGFVHRDVKPDNIFLGKAGAVKLGDFGLARDRAGAAGMSMKGDLMGTPLYMAPEQCRGLSVDGRADLYSLGATAFHMVTGRPPFAGETGAVVMAKHMNEPVPAASALVAGIPPAVDALLRRLLEKEPGLRPGAAGEVVATIEALLAGQPVPWVRAAPAGLRADAGGVAALPGPPHAPAPPPPPAGAAPVPPGPAARGERAGQAQATVPTRVRPAPRSRWRRVLAGLAAALVLAGGAALLSTAGLEYVRRAAMRHLKEGEVAPWVIRQVGWVYGHTGRHEEATRTWWQSIAQGDPARPEYPEHMFRYAQALEDWGDSLAPTEARRKELRERALKAYLDFVACFPQHERRSAAEEAARRLQTGPR